MLVLMQIKKRADDGELNINFLGRVDHLDERLRPYKVCRFVCLSAGRLAVSGLSIRYGESFRHQVSGLRRPLGRAFAAR